MLLFLVHIPCKVSGFPVGASNSLKKMKLNLQRRMVSLEDWGAGGLKTYSFSFGYCFVVHSTYKVWGFQLGHQLKRPFWTRSWPGSLSEPDFGSLPGRRPAIQLLNMGMS